MKELTKGKKMWFHESGTIFEVEVIDFYVKKYGNTEGQAIKLRALGNTKSAGNMKESSLPENSDEFEVWAAHDAGAYAGWFLLDY